MKFYIGDLGNYYNEDDNRFRTILSDSTILYLNLEVFNNRKEIIKDLTKYEWRTEWNL
jgi:5'(3')-deoxyribonucleotidase